MPPRFIPILGRLRQDIAAGLSRESIEVACRQVDYRWLRRVVDLATTRYRFLLLVLHGNTACRPVVHFGGWTFTDSAYGLARGRLPRPCKTGSSSGRRYTKLGRVGVNFASGVARSGDEVSATRRAECTSEGGLCG